MEIVKFVESHTPLDRARREEEKRRKEAQAEEVAKKLAEMEQAISRSAMPEKMDDDYFIRLDRARAEREKAEKERK